MWTFGVLAPVLLSRNEDARLTAQTGLSEAAGPPLSSSLPLPLAGP